MLKMNINKQIGHGIHGRQHNFNKNINQKYVLSLCPSKPFKVNVFQHRFPDWQVNHTHAKCSCTVQNFSFTDSLECVC